MIKGKEEKNKNVASERSEVRFAISKYEDIFSDFDPRPVSLKGFSDDFLTESKRAVIVKEEKIDFIFMVPKKERNAKEEANIEDRLKRYFKKHLEISEKRKMKTMKFGAAFVTIGVILMLTATWLFFKYRETSFLTSFFTILLEPASWFLFWEGLSQLIFESKKINPDLDFHRKMADAKISFISV